MSGMVRVYRKLETDEGRPAERTKWNGRHGDPNLGVSMRTLTRAAMISATLALAIPFAGPPSACAAGGTKTFVATRPSVPIPEIAVLSTEGEPETLSDAFPRGVPVVLNLWATWCAPCVAELPSLARMSAVLGGDAGVVALSVDRGGPLAVGKFLVGNGITGLTVKLDPRGDALPALGVRGLPVTLLLDADHREVARYEGAAEWDSPEIIAKVRMLVGAKRAE